MATGEHQVRWVHVNEVDIQAFTKRGYDRLDIRPVPAPKRRKGDDAGVPESP